ncbi:MAG: hypothetical protein RLY14_698 [Planctomycetota bacterium]|jgi:hypothetical protein
MVDFFRRYWIAGLVLLLVIIHGSIIGYIRSQASRLQTTVSREFSLGEFQFVSPDRKTWTRFQVHAVLTHNRRFQGRNTLNQHFWQVHEAIEQYFRHTEPALLKDPKMVEMKAGLKKVIDERVGDSLIDQVLVTQFMELPVFPANLPTQPQASDLVNTKPHNGDFQEAKEESKDSHTATHSGEDKAGHGSDHGVAKGDGHGDSHGTASSGSHGIDPADGHGQSHGASAEVAHAKSEDHGGTHVDSGKEAHATEHSEPHEEPAH